MLQEQVVAEVTTPAPQRLAKVDLPAIDPDEPAAAIVHAVLWRGVDRIRNCDASARGGEPDGVHRLRTATRRLRSELRTFEDLLAPGWADPIEAELKWLAGKLGAVRDLDVLRGRLAESAEGEFEALGPLFEALDARHVEASNSLRLALNDERYRALREATSRAAAMPELVDRARKSCRKVLPRLAGATWKKLARDARALTPDRPDAEFHDVRKRAKRARYAAEAVAIALDDRAARQAKRFAREATKVQDILGDHQDAVVAVAEVGRVVREHPEDGSFGFAAGRLIERQSRAADTSRAAFFDAWDAFDRKRLRRWLEP